VHAQYSRVTAVLLSTPIKHTSSKTQLSTLVPLSWPPRKRYVRGSRWSGILPASLLRCARKTFRKPHRLNDAIGARTSLKTQVSTLVSSARSSCSSYLLTHRFDEDLLVTQTFAATHSNARLHTSFFLYQIPRHPSLTVFIQCVLQFASPSGISHL